MKLPQLSLRDPATSLAVFTGLGFFTAMLVYWNAPGIWSGCIVAGAAAGIAGVVCWVPLCGGPDRPVYWRTIIAGALAGVLSHPIYWELESLTQDGELFGLQDLSVATLFSLLVAGFFTIPAGVIASLICRILKPSPKAHPPLLPYAQIE